MTDARGLVIDTSAATAILFGEPGARWLTDTLAGSSQRLMPTATYIELGIVVEARLGPAATGAAARFVRDAQVTLVDVDMATAERALEGWRRYGKGRHPAALNLGDCFVYGLASELDLPVLCIGNDFAETDLAALRPPARHP